jgi:hypothetical protein
MPTTDTKKRRAYTLVRTALKRGDLQRPKHCSRCDVDPGLGRDGRSKIQAHHHLGYEHPLSVEWLCVLCHAAETPQPTGENHAGCKIPDELVPRIISYPRGTKRTAEAFGISRRYVRELRAGLWRGPALASPSDSSGDNEGGKKG